MVAEKELLIVACEALSAEEEVDFLQDINNAVANGDLSDEEAIAMIDREYELLALAK